MSLRGSLAELRCHTQIGKYRISNRRQHREVFGNVETPHRHERGDALKKIKLPREHRAVANLSGLMSSRK